jgi:hypothetical protein
VTVHELERSLVAAAPHYRFPPTPDLAGAARVRLPERRPARVVRRPLLVAAAVLVAAACGLLAVSPGARSAVLDLLDRVPGIRIERASALPAVPYRQFPEWGTQVSLERAKAIFRGPLLLPRDFGDPNRVYWAPFPPGDPITAIWGNGREGRLVITQWRVGGPYLFYKVLSLETNVESVSVDGAPGIWMHGGDHIVFYLAPGERNPDVALHHRSEGVLAGNVLAWRNGDLIYRLEAQVSKERALELAHSLEPR